MRKKIVNFMTMLMLLLCLNVPVQAKTDDNFSAEVRNSVAVVYSSFDTTAGVAESWGWGTGFFVGQTDQNPEYLVTNHHVIAQYLENGEGELVDKKIDEKVVQGRAIIKVFFDSNDYVEAYVVDSDRSKDLALLRLDEPTDMRRSLKICEPTDGMVGDPVYAVGYPGLAENVFTQATSRWSEKDASVTGGTISRLLTTSGTGVRLVQIDAVIRHGNSGGPLVDKTGAAIGVCCNIVSTSAFKDAGIVETENVSYGVRMQELLPMLKLHDVPYESVEPDSDNTIIYICIAIIAITVIFAVIAVLFLKRKNKKTAPVKEKKNKKGSAGKESPVSSAPNPKTPVIRSLLPQHNGMCVSVRRRQVMIGRDKSTCAIAYADDTAGVSEKHCSVHWDESAGDFILTDLKSTYGTYLKTGQKLEAGVAYRLRPGDSFYLGEKKNMLRVEME